MTIYSNIEKFLNSYCVSANPILLALSGGADSLCLFYCLLTYRKQHGTPFHIAHVNHGWREESQKEAEALENLANGHQVPFHFKKLDPESLKGNLEAASRNARYAFFLELCQKLNLQGVLTGHHQGDHVETIFKRVLEGAHWSRWVGLKKETWINGLRVLRPLLTISKNEIVNMLAKEDILPFDDPTNHQMKYMRARLREHIIPWLNQKFGKNVQKSFVEIGEEAEELIGYFEERVSPLLNSLVRGPWGFYLDLQDTLPKSSIEIKFLLRLICKKISFHLSREILDQAAHALQHGKANQLFVMGKSQVWIDRCRIFILDHPLKNEEKTQYLYPGNFSFSHWNVTVAKEVYSSDQTTSWKEGWQGSLRGYLPLDNYKIAFKSEIDHRLLTPVRKRWNIAKVPNFLHGFFPLVYVDSQISHEFLTGKGLVSINEGTPCLKIEMLYQP